MAFEQWLSQNFGIGGPGQPSIKAMSKLPAPPVSPQVVAMQAQQAAAQPYQPNGGQQQVQQGHVDALRALLGAGFAQPGNYNADAQPWSPSAASQHINALPTDVVQGPTPADQYTASQQMPTQMMLNNMIASQQGGGGGGFFGGIGDAVGGVANAGWNLAQDSPPAMIAKAGYDSVPSIIDAVKAANDASQNWTAAQAINPLAMMISHELGIDQVSAENVLNAMKSAKSAVPFVGDSVKGIAGSAKDAVTGIDQDSVVNAVNKAMSPEFVQALGQLMHDPTATLSAGGAKMSNRFDDLIHGRDIFKGFEGTGYETAPKDFVNTFNDVMTTNPISTAKDINAAVEKYGSGQALTGQELPKVFNQLMAAAGEAPIVGDVMKIQQIPAQRMMDGMGQTIYDQSIGKDTKGFWDKVGGTWGEMLNAGAEEFAKDPKNYRDITNAYTYGIDLNGDGKIGDDEKGDKAVFALWFNKQHPTNGNLFNFISTIVSGAGFDPTIWLHPMNVVGEGLLESGTLSAQAIRDINATAETEGNLSKAMNTVSAAAPDDTVMSSAAKAQATTADEASNYAAAQKVPAPGKVFSPEAISIAQKVIGNALKAPQSAIDAIVHLPIDVAQTVRDVLNSKDPRIMDAVSSPFDLGDHSKYNKAASDGADAINAYVDSIENNKPGMSATGAATDTGGASPTGTGGTTPPEKPAGPTSPTEPTKPTAPAEPPATSDPNAPVDTTGVRVKSGVSSDKKKVTYVGNDQPNAWRVVQNNATETAPARYSIQFKAEGTNRWYDSQVADPEKYDPLSRDSTIAYTKELYVRQSGYKAPLDSTISPSTAGMTGEPTLVATTDATMDTPVPTRTSTGASVDKVGDGPDASYMVMDHNKGVWIIEKKGDRFNVEDPSGTLVMQTETPADAVNYVDQQIAKSPGSPKPAITEEPAPAETKPAEPASVEAPAEPTPAEEPKPADSTPAEEAPAETPSEEPATATYNPDTGDVSAPVVRRRGTYDQPGNRPAYEPLRNRVPSETPPTEPAAPAEPQPVPRRGNYQTPAKPDREYISRWKERMDAGMDAKEAAPIVQPPKPRTMADIVSAKSDEHPNDYLMAEIRRDREAKALHQQSLDARVAALEEQAKRSPRTGPIQETPQVEQPVMASQPEQPATQTSAPTQAETPAAPTNSREPNSHEQGITYEGVDPEKVRPALDAIDKAHGRIDDANVIVKSGDVGSVEGKRVLGSHKYTDENGSVITIGTDGPRSDYTFIHEYGHYVDDRMLGETSNSYMNPEFRKAMSPAEQELWSAMTESDQAKEWGAIYDTGKEKDLSKYAVSPKEMFARAYAQWVIEKSGDPELMATLEKLKEKGKLTWPDDQFAPISEAMDKVFSENDLTKVEPTPAAPAAPPKPPATGPDVYEVKKGSNKIWVKHSDGTEEVFDDTHKYNTKAKTEAKRLTDNARAKWDGANPTKTPPFTPETAGPKTLDYIDNYKTMKFEDRIDARFEMEDELKAAGYQDWELRAARIDAELKAGRDPFLDEYVTKRNNPESIPDAAPKAEEKTTGTGTGTGTGEAAPMTQTERVHDNTFVLNTEKGSGVAAEPAPAGHRPATASEMETPVVKPDGSPLKWRKNKNGDPVFLPLDDMDRANLQELISRKMKGSDDRVLVDPDGRVGGIAFGDEDAQQLTMGQYKVVNEAYADRTGEKQYTIQTRTKDLAKKNAGASIADLADRAKARRESAAATTTSTEMPAPTAEPALKMPEATPVEKPAPVSTTADPTQRPMWHDGKRIVYVDDLTSGSGADRAKRVQSLFADKDAGKAIFAHEPDSGLGPNGEGANHLAPDGTILKPSPPVVSVETPPTAEAAPVAKPAPTATPRPASRDASPYQPSPRARVESPNKLIIPKIMNRVEELSDDVNYSSFKAATDGVVAKLVKEGDDARAIADKAKVEIAGKSGPEFERIAATKNKAWNDVNLSAMEANVTVIKEFARNFKGEDFPLPQVDEGLRWDAKLKHEDQGILEKDPWASRRINEDEVTSKLIPGESDGKFTPNLHRIKEKLVRGKGTLNDKRLTSPGWDIGSEENGYEVRPKFFNHEFTGDYDVVSRKTGEVIKKDLMPNEAIQFGDEAMGPAKAQFPHENPGYVMQKAIYEQGPSSDQAFKYLEKRIVPDGKTVNQGSITQAQYDRIAQMRADMQQARATQGTSMMGDIKNQGIVSRDPFAKAIGTAIGRVMEPVVGAAKDYLLSEKEFIQLRDELNTADGMVKYNQLRDLPKSLVDMGVLNLDYATAVSRPVLDEAGNITTIADRYQALRASLMPVEDAKAKVYNEWLTDLKSKVTQEDRQAINDYKVMKTVKGVQAIDAKATAADKAALMKKIESGVALTTKEKAMIPNLSIADQTRARSWFMKGLGKIEQFQKTVKENMLTNPASAPRQLLANGTYDSYIATMTGHADAVGMMVRDKGTIFRAAVESDPKILNEMESIYATRESGGFLPSELTSRHANDLVSSDMSEAEAAFKRSDKMRIARFIENNMKMSEGGKAEWVTDRSTSVVASKFWMDIKTMQSDANRIFVYEDTKRALLPEVYRDFEKKLLEKHGEGNFKPFMADIKASARMKAEARGQEYMGGYSPSDVFKGINDSDLAKGLTGAMKDVEVQSVKEMERVTFSNHQTKIDEAIGKVAFFNYWSSRASFLHVDMLLHNPFMLNNYMRAWDAMQRDAKARGLSGTMAVFFNFMGNTSHGMYSMVDPINMLVPLSQVLDLGNSNDPWWKRVGVALAPIVGAGLAAAGQVQSTPNLTGFSAPANMARIFYDFAKSHGVTLPGADGEQLSADYLSNVENNLTKGMNWALREGASIAGVSIPKFDPVDPRATPYLKLRALIHYHAEQEFGPEFGPNHTLLWTPEQVAIVSDADTRANFSGQGGGHMEDNRFANQAYDEYTKALAAGAVEKLMLAITVRDAPYDNMKANAKAGQAATDAGGVATGVQQDAMDTKGLVETGTPDAYALRIEHNFPAQAAGAGNRIGESYALAHSQITGGDAAKYLNPHTGQTDAEFDAEFSKKSYAEKDAIFQQWLQQRHGDKAVVAYNKYISDKGAVSDALPEQAAYKSWQSNIGKIAADPALLRQYIQQNPRYKAYLDKFAQSLPADVRSDPAKLANAMAAAQMSQNAYWATMGEKGSMYDTINGKVGPDPMGNILLNAGGTGAGGSSNLSTQDQVIKYVNQYNKDVATFNVALQSYTGNPNANLANMNPQLQQAMIWQLGQLGIKAPFMPRIVKKYLSWKNSGESKGTDGSASAYATYIGDQASALLDPNDPANQIDYSSSTGGATPQGTVSAGYGAPMVPNSNSIMAGYFGGGGGGSDPMYGMGSISAPIQSGNQLMGGFSQSPYLSPTQIMGGATQ